MLTTISLWLLFALSVPGAEGITTPVDKFQPQILVPDEFPDPGALDAVFENTRKELLIPDPEDPEGQRYIAIVTPGRLAMLMACPLPGSMPREEVERIEMILPPKPSLKVTVIGYTRFDALQEDASKAIPFLGYLFAFGYIGHSVVVFEGHPSAFRSGVRDSDVLMVDSGMLPFLQPDWLETAFQIMRPGGRVFIHNREDFTLTLVREKPPGEKGRKVA